MLKPLSSMIGILDDRTAQLGRESLQQTSVLISIQMIVACAKQKLDEAIKSGDINAVKLHVDDLIAKIEFQLRESGAFSTAFSTETQMPADASKPE